jgi:RHS repeat-associated protein
MSNKSNDTASLISLPKGGGALSGLGEKFSPDLHTGTGNFSIPLALPAGRNGFQPQLTLSYSTGQGQGLFGLGWALSLPGVSRKTSKGLPRYQDEDALSDEADVFILSGAEDLVPIEAPEPGRTRYQPRTEGLFARIERHRNSAQAKDYWEVRTKDGLTSFYGTNPLDMPSYPAALAGGSGDQAVTSKPDSPKRIFSWALTLTLDPFQNRIEYLYERQRSGLIDEDQGHHWDVPVLKMIRYGDHGDRTSPGFLVTVEFEYEERPDPFSDCRAGFEIRQTRRCRSVIVKTHAGAERTVKEYRFRYRNDAGTSVSLLETVEVYGFDPSGGPVLSLPPLELSYTPFEPERRDRRDFFPVRGNQLPVVSLAHPTLALVDLHGQGLPDIFELGETVRYWRNLGGGEFDMPRPMREAPAGLSLGDPGVQLMDADGDGRMDLMVTRESISGYFPLRFGPTWDRRSFRRWDAAPSFDLKDPEVRLLDLTGDGVTDALRTGSRLECYFNHPEKGWRAGRRLDRKPLAVFPDVVFSDPRVLTGDMNGDGLTDIVFVHNGSLCYWPSHGYGDFGPRIQMRNGPRLPADYDPKRLLLGDVNGDGLADLVYVDHRCVYLWINQSGNAWSEPIIIKGTPGVTNEDAIRLVDLLGSGVSGILWSSDKVEPGRPNYFFLDLTGGVKPYLLRGMHNNLGAETRVEYRPSTQFYLDDRRRGSTPWNTTLPFPVQTVARVEVMDALSGGRLVTSYTYHHGYWDGHEREFRGFGRVEQLDAETFADSAGSGGAAGAPPQHTYSPPLLSKSWFHQGPVENEDGTWQELDCAPEHWSEDPSHLGQSDLIRRLLLELEQGIDAGPSRLSSAQRTRIHRDALRSLRGSLLRTELYALDGAPRQDRPYTVTESLFGFREEAAPGPAQADRRRIFFSHARAQRTTQWERGDDPMTQLGFTHRYDAFGQVLSQTQIACPRGWRGPLDRPTAPYLATRVVTTYAKPDANGSYIHDRVARGDSFEIGATEQKMVNEIAGVSDADPSLIRIGQGLSFYDGDAFQGLDLGNVGAHGALSRSETLVLTPERLEQVYGAQIPAYVKPGPVPWPAEYPAIAGTAATFRSTAPVLAGYVQHDGTEPALPGVAAGLFSVTERIEHDFQANSTGVSRGLVLRQRNPMGHDATLSYSFDSLPESVTDAAGLTTRAKYDLRFFQPDAVTDPNGNQQTFEFRSDGLLAAVRVFGKTATEGDSGRASVQYSYDLFAYQTRAQPISVATLRYEHHDTEPGLSATALAATLETREYSDGFGRLLQARAQGETLRFGDARFGHGVLPEDQTVPSLAAVAATVANDPAQPHVTVSGWQIYDNKGRVVQKYEPFFSEGWDYEPPEDAHKGQSLRMFYDPRGQVIRTLHPDGSEERVVHGVPGTIVHPDLTDPALFEPTPWEAYSYDANDNAGRTHAATTLSFRHCRNTPASVEVDALGRTIRSVERNCEHAPSLAAAVPVIAEHTTRFRYDIQGNVTEIVDALNRVAFTNSYDLAKHALYTNSIDAGERRLVLNAAGMELERRDSKGALALQEYDVLERPRRLWARDSATEPVTLRGAMTYGDELPPTAGPADHNLLGKPHVQHDGAGTLTFASYDFKGNLLETTREVIADSAIAAQVDAGAGLARKLVVNWDAPPALEGAYTTSVSYDALNRMTLTRLPVDEAGERKAIVPVYNRGGALEAVSLAGDTYVSRIAYNAKGQRVLVAYGNGYLTRYAYDPRTLRLVRLRTERFKLAAGAAGDPPSYEPLGGVLQDFGYVYDLTGNILTMRDRAPSSGVQGAQLGDDALDRVFEYDALSRLTCATGRESKSQAAWPLTQANPFAAALDRSSSADGTTFGSPGNTTKPHLAPQQTGEYKEAYTYDPAGNLVELWHKSGARSSWSRHFGMGGCTPNDWKQSFPQHVEGAAVWLNPPSNRLTHVGDNAPNAPQTHTFDASGNLLLENGVRHFVWNYGDQMAGFSVRPNAAAPASIEACYLYDSSGQRVKKWVRKAATVETTVYIDGVFERHDDGTTANNTLHVVDGQSRIATRRVGPAFADEGAPDIAIKYHLRDQLGSSHVVIGIDSTAQSVLVSREEFFPHGETSYGGFGRKRYRFTGKERDEESGLHYHGARYYGPWLLRWISPDPAGIGLRVGLYGYAGNSPLSMVDPSGLAEVPAETPADPDQGTPGTVANTLGATTEAHGRAALETRGIEFRPNVVLDATGAEVPASESGLRAPRPVNSQEFDAKKRVGPDVDWKGVGKTEAPAKYVSEKAIKTIDQQFDHMTVSKKSQTALLVTYNLAEKEVNALRAGIQKSGAARFGELMDALKGLNYKLYKELKDKQLKIGLGVTTLQSLTKLTAAAAKQTAKSLLPDEVTIPYDHLKLVGGGSALSGARFVLQYSSTTLVTQAGVMISEAAVTVGTVGTAVVGALSALAAPFFINPNLYSPQSNFGPMM